MWRLRHHHGTGNPEKGQNFNELFMQKISFRTFDGTATGESQINYVLIRCNLILIGLPLPALDFVDPQEGTGDHHRTRELFSVGV